MSGYLKSVSIILSGLGIPSFFFILLCCVEGCSSMPVNIVEMEGYIVKVKVGETHIHGTYMDFNYVDGEIENYLKDKTYYKIEQLYFHKLCPLKEGNYYMIRYDKESRKIVSVRRPIKKNREIKEKIDNYKPVVKSDPVVGDVCPRDATLEEIKLFYKLRSKNVKLTSGFWETND